MPTSEEQQEAHMMFRRTFLQAGEANTPAVRGTYLSNRLAEETSRMLNADSLVVDNNKGDGLVMYFDGQVVDMDAAMWSQASRGSEVAYYGSSNDWNERMGFRAGAHARQIQQHEFEQTTTSANVDPVLMQDQLSSSTTLQQLAHEAPARVEPSLPVDLLVPVPALDMNSYYGWISSNGLQTYGSGW